MGLVLLLPLILGFKGIPFDDQVVSICRLCPAGALEAGVPYSIQSLFAGNGWLMSWFKTGILLAFFARRCSSTAPGAASFARWAGSWRLFNRFSLFHLRFNAKECVECNLCRSRCPMGVKVDQKVNVSGCVRCLECATCGALEPCFAFPQDTPTQTPPGPTNNPAAK